eukprot:g4777.t1
MSVAQGVPQRLPRRAGLKILEKYKVVKELGRGAFGAALLVTRRSDDKNFVMKKIDLVNMPPQEKKAAELEVKVLKNLQHHNIVKYIESGFEENQRSGNNRFRTSHLLIVMEFANGGDLSALVAKQKKIVPRKYFKENRIMRIIIQCMIALGYMHSKHIMHRDIKSANVFLHNQGTRMEIVKLGDFGIAKVLDNTMAKARTVAGTPYYMSPEICKDQAYTIKSDVWSLGILLHELALLDFPFNASNLLGLVQKVVKQPAKRLPSMFSKEFRTLATEMLSKDPRKRPDIRHILRKPYVRKGVENLLQETQMKVKSISEDEDLKIKTPRGLATRMKKIQDDISKLKVGGNRRPSRHQKQRELERAQHLKHQRELARKRAAKEQRQLEEAEEIRLQKKEQNRKMRQKYAEKRRKQREQMLRDRKRSKEQLDKRPAWNNDWHKDDVEVLVNDQQYETVKLQQQCEQNVLQQEEMQGEVIDELPPGNRRNVIDRYLKNGTTDFQLDNGANTRANSKPNPFSRNGAFKDASGSAVAKKQSSSSNEDTDNGINDDKEQTSEIVFDQNRNGAVKMPVNAPYDKYNVRKQQPHVGNSGWRSNEPSPYGYQQQPRLQHQRGGDGNVIYTESPQREQYRRDIAAEERRRIYEQNQQAMLQNKRRHEEEVRRHHPSAIGHYVRATSAPLQESGNGRQRHDNGGLSAEDIKKARLRRRESDDIQYREQLKLVREEAHQERLRILAKKKERERQEAQQRQQYQAQFQNDAPTSKPPRTRKQVMEEKRLAQDKKNEEHLKQLAKARLENFQLRQKLHHKHQRRSNSQVDNVNPNALALGSKPMKERDESSSNTTTNNSLKNTGKQKSEELGNAQTDAVMKAVMAETMNLDLTTSIAISEDDLWENNNTKDDEKSAEDIVGLAESLINILGGDEVTKNFFTNSSAVDPNHDKVRLPGRKTRNNDNKSNKPGRLNIDNMGLQNDGELDDESFLVKMSGKTYQKPVTPLDQSTDSLGVLYRKARGHGGTRIDL